VRSILVPASMKLPGKWNWYLPSMLHWLPKVQAEGAHAAPADRRIPGAQEWAAGD